MLTAYFLVTQRFVSLGTSVITSADVIKGIKNVVSSDTCGPMIPAPLVATSVNITIAPSKAVAAASLHLRQKSSSLAFAVSATSPIQTVQYRVVFTYLSTATTSCPPEVFTYYKAVTATLSGMQASGLFAQYLLDSNPMLNMSAQLITFSGPFSSAGVSCGGNSTSGAGAQSNSASTTTNGSNMLAILIPSILIPLLLLLALLLYFRWRHQSRVASGDPNLVQKPVPQQTASRRKSLFPLGSEAVVPVDLADAVSKELKQWEENGSFA